MSKKQSQIGRQRTNTSMVLAENKRLFDFGRQHHHEQMMTYQVPVYRSIMALNVHLAALGGMFAAGTPGLIRHQIDVVYRDLMPLMRDLRVQIKQAERAGFQQSVTGFDNVWELHQLCENFLADPSDNGEQIRLHLAAHDPVWKQPFELRSEYGPGRRAGKRSEIVWLCELAIALRDDPDNGLTTEASITEYILNDLAAQHEQKKLKDQALKAYEIMAEWDDPHISLWRHVRDLEGRK